MYSIISTTSKQVLVWAVMFTLVLSVFPTVIADEDDEEWFWDIEGEVYDEDGDGSDDTIEIGYDPDTTCDCNISITVYVDIYDENGYLGYIYEDYTIYDEAGDWFTQDWTPDNSGTFDFYVSLYDEWDNFEDSWNMTGVELEPMSGSSDETINVDNRVGDFHGDGINNDIGMFAFIKDDPVEGVEVNVEYFNGMNWTFYTNGTTDDYGEFVVENATNGEYRWIAEYDGEDLEEETLSYTEVDIAMNLSHMFAVDDWDDAGDYDDFLGLILEGDDSKDDGYVEVYDDAGDLYDSGTTDAEFWGYNVYLLHDVEKGNYTFNMYYEENGELLQSGWLHSYGSTSTNYDEWFDSWDYETEDTNGDGEANSITTSYDPDTECNCTVEIEVSMDVYNNDTGDWVDYDNYYYEINGTQDDWFETDDWSPGRNANYTFEFYLYDENWNYEDHFNFTVYLECDDDSNNSDGCDNDEWFEDWDSESVDTDDDNLYDTLDISYNPDTDCDCEVEIEVEVYVYENSTGDWVDSMYDYHTINGTEEEYFEQSWTSHESQSYDFYVYMYDDDWNSEDEFWIYNVYLYQKSGGGGPGDDDEYFDWIYEDVWDDDDDGYNDTVELDYDPDTTCECDINITVFIDVYDNDTGAWVDGTDNNYTIYHDEDDYFYETWSPEYNGTFDFYVEMNDEDGNLEEEVEYLGVELHVRSSGGDGDDDEWFDYWDYDVYPSDTITIGYDPDTECECNITVTVYIDVYESDTGDYIDYVYAEHDIYNGYGDWFTQDWTAWNDDYYDFNVSMYDEEWNYEDQFWIYDVYLSSDDGGGGNGTGDDNGVGHIGVIDDWEEDGYVNDYIGGVLEDDEFKEDAYFEIYDEEGNLVDSGNPNYYDAFFVSSNLTEGWYYQDVYYEEDDAMLQTGPFYSYGNSTEFEVVNVDNLVVDDDEYAVYDDVGFMAHQGAWGDDEGVADVGIEIYKYNEESGDWEYHAYLETNETGEAWLYNEICGQYEWSASVDDEKGYYEVWAGCEGTGGGGDEDYDEWFYSWDYDVNPSDTIHIGYDPDTDCECYVDIEVYIDIFDNQTGDYVGSLYDEHTIYHGQGDSFEQDWTADYEGTYDFRVELYDPEYGHEEDSFWIYDVYLSSDGGDEDYDEWFYNWDYRGKYDENDEHIWSEVVIGYDPNTDCDCHVDIEVYIDVFDNQTGDYVDSIYDNHTIYNGDSDWLEQQWTANYAGKYDFYVELYDQEYGHPEDSFKFSLIMSDEWFGNDWHQEDITVYIDLDPATNYEGEIDTHYEVLVLRHNESNDDWEYVDTLASYSIPISGSNDNEDVHFEWTAEEDGKYRFVIYMYDVYWNLEHMLDFETEFVLNHAPEIGELNKDWVFEGQMVDFKVDAWDEDGDDLKFTWDMGDGEKREGESVRYGYPDNGTYTIEVSVSDGEATTVKEFEVKVENQDPELTVSFTDEADEGSELSFAAQVDDVPMDDVTVTWTFADGSKLDGIFVKYDFNDDGEYLITVVAEDEDGGITEEQIIVTIKNVNPIFTEFVMPSNAEEGEALNFMVTATDPGDDTITYTFDFGDGTAVMMSPDGNISHKFAEGDTFDVIICAKDEDGGETCRTETIPVSVLEQLEEEGLLPGFGLLGALSALAVIGILRRRTH